MEKLCYDRVLFEVATEKEKDRIVEIQVAMRKRARTAEKQGQRLLQLATDEELEELERIYEGLEVRLKARPLPPEVMAAIRRSAQLQAERMAEMTDLEIEAEICELERRFPEFASE
jgi:hypothetical protein